MQSRKQHLSLVQSSERSQAGDAMESVKSHFQRVQPLAPAHAEFYWTCPTCGLVEPYFIPAKPGRWIRRSCACERAQRQKLQEQRERELWRATYRKRTYGGWLGESWIDEDIVAQMSTKTFANYDRSRFPAAYDAAWDFAHRLKGNLIFSGSLGTGKTHLEAAIANFLREETPPRRSGEYGIASLLASAPQFFMVHDQTKKMFDQSNYLSLIQQAIETPLLILDDIDKSRPREDREEVYYHIIDERYKAKRPTVLSTNKIEMLSSYIGEAAMDRLMRGMIPVKMTGNSYRLEEED
jgi:DNA replication protein DnaC